MMNPKAQKKRIQLKESRYIWCIFSHKKSFLKLQNLFYSFKKNAYYFNIFFFLQPKGKGWLSGFGWWSSSNGVKATDLENHLGQRSQIYQIIIAWKIHKTKVIVFSIHLNWRLRINTKKNFNLSVKLLLFHS